MTQEKIVAELKVQIILNAETLSLHGKKILESLTYRDKKTNKEITIPAEGVFVEIGIVPNSDLLKDFVIQNERNEIVVNPETQQTSHQRIWAAGDVTNGHYRQNNISVGDAIKAVLHIYECLHRA